MAARDAGNTRDIQSLHRASDILEAIGRSGELGVTEIAKRTSLPVSTVHNLLRTLAKRHYVMSTNGRYRLGPAVIVLTSQWDPVRSLAHTVERHVASMVMMPGQAAYAGMLVGDRARVIAYSSTAGAMIINEHHDDNAEPLEIATGRLLVAMTRQSDFDHFIEAASTHQPERTRRQWRDEFRSIASTGVSVRHIPSPEESTSVMIAVPVWGPNDTVICSIALSTPTMQLSEAVVAAVVDSLWTATTGLSAELGCPQIPLPKPDPRLPALRALITDSAPSS